MTGLNAGHGKELSLIVNTAVFRKLLKTTLFIRAEPAKSNNQMHNGLISPFLYILVCLFLQA